MEYKKIGVKNAPRYILERVSAGSKRAVDFSFCYIFSAPLLCSQHRNSAAVIGNVISDCLASRQQREWFSQVKKGRMIKSLASSRIEFYNLDILFYILATK